MPASAHPTSADVLVIGWGLAGLVAATEAVAAGRRVIIVEQEPRTNLGGQAQWSFGGLFLVDSPEQRRMGINDSFELAPAGLVRHRRVRPRRGRLGAALGGGVPRVRAGEKRAWLGSRASGSSPSSAGRNAAATRRPATATPCRGSTSSGAPAPPSSHRSRPRSRRARRAGRVTILPRHRVDELVTRRRRGHRCRGDVLAPSGAARGRPARARWSASSRSPPGARSSRPGGIGGNHDLVRAAVARTARAPRRRRCSPAFPRTSTGRCWPIAETRGRPADQRRPHVALRRGHPELGSGLAAHGIRILPGPSSLWLDATGQRLPGPLFPGFDTLGTLEHLRATGHDH